MKKRKEVIQYMRGINLKTGLIYLVIMLFSSALFIIATKEYSLLWYTSGLSLFVYFLTYFIVQHDMEKHWHSYYEKLYDLRKQARELLKKYDENENI